jgi:hypothetical protein
VFREQVALEEGSDCQDSVAFGGVYRQALKKIGYSYLKCKNTLVFS